MAKKWIIFLVFFLSSAVLIAQTIETRRVAEASGATLAEKVTAAQTGCTGGTSCYIIFDVGLPKVSGEDIGSPCGNCTWIDYRTPHAKNMGTSPPGTCEIGDEFFDTDATAGQNKYGCTATNTWTLLGDGGGGGSGDITDVGNCATGACFQSVSQAQVLASPTGSTGQMSPRALVSSDLPSHSHAESDVTNLVSDLAAKEASANKDAANGYAGLDSGAKIAAAQLPNPSASTLGGVKSLACTGTDKLSAIGTDGTPSCSADQTGGGGAPIDATYIVQTANGTLTAEQAMGALATGLVKNTTSTGVQSIAVAGTDYQAPVSSSVNQLSSDVTMTTAGTFYNGPSLSLTAGTYFLSGTVTLQTTSVTAAVQFVCKLWDGTTVGASTEAVAGATSSAAVKNEPISLSAIVVPTGAATWRIACTSNTASQLIKAATPQYGAGNNASTLVALKIL